MVRRVMTTEAVALAALAVAVGTGLSIVAAWATVRFVFELPFDPPAIPLLALAAATLLVGSVLGAGRSDAHRRPLAALREAEQTGAA
jgi:predicted lysophospholipase L1 biosynthesis ABC-type transport system permease subunit